MVRRPSPRTSALYLCVFIASVCLVPLVVTAYIQSSAGSAGTSVAGATGASSSGPAGTSAAGALGITGKPAFLVGRSFPVTGSPSGIAAADFNGDGRTDLAVISATDATVAVYLRQTNGAFQKLAAYSVGKHPSAVVVADFDGDGKPDIAVANQASNSISVLRGNGDGTLQPAVSYSVPAGPVFLATGNLSGQGHADLAVASGDANSISILTNNGDGSFQSAKEYAVGASPRSVAIGDFNGDNKLDLASANADGSLTILSGDGRNGFGLSASYHIGTSLSSVVAADFNADGHVDLAVSDSSESAVDLLLGNGDGSFRPTAHLSVGHGPVALAVADLNGDQVPDLITANQSANTVSILLGKGDGSFSALTDFVVGNGPIAVAVADLDSDGHPDLALANFTDGTVSTPIGNGDGTFQAAQSYRTNLDVQSIAAGDLDGDGQVDMVIANFCGTDSACASTGTATVLLNNGDGSFRKSSTFALGRGPVAVALADVNGDKKLDLVAVNQNDNMVTVMFGNGDATFQQPLVYPTGKRPVAAAVADLNKDGKADLIVVTQCGAGGCDQPGEVSVLLANGDGSFREAGAYSAGFLPVSVTAGDLNGDGNVDLVVANACGNSAACSGGTATVLLGDGKGTFKAGAELNLDKSPSAVTLGRLRSSGTLDLVVAYKADSKVGVLQGNGDGTFKAQTFYGVGSGPSSVIVRDFDGDGHADVAVANLNSSTVSVLNGNGDGTLRQPVDYPVGSSPSSIIATNLTAKGRPDIVSANGTGPAATSQVTVLRNLAPATALTATNTTLSPLSPVASGTAVTFTATVSPAPSDSTADDVTFLDGTTKLGTGTADPNTGIATFTTTAGQLSPGSHSITAVFAATATFDTSTSPALIQTVTRHTTTSVSFNPSSVVVNQPSTATITVTDDDADTAGASSPAGTVAVSSDSNDTITGPCTLSPGNTGVSTCQVTITPSGQGTGTHNITASYPGSAVHTASTSAATPLTLITRHTTSTLSFSTNPVVVNQSTTVTLTVTDDDPNGTAVTPAGTITFSSAVGSDILGSGTCVLAGSGATASCSLTLTGKSANPSLHSITATFPVDDMHSGSSDTKDLTVNTRHTASVLSFSTNPVVVNQSTTVTLTVTDDDPNGTALTPAGTITFSSAVGSDVLNPANPTTCTLSGSGATASCTVTLTGKSANPSLHAVTGTFSADDVHSAGSDTESLTVNTRHTSTSVSFNPSSLVVNRPSIATITVTDDDANTAGASSPTGTVAVSSDSGDTITGTCTLTAGNTGVSTCQVTIKPKGKGTGTHNITASYPGSDVHTASTSAATPLTVTTRHTSTSVSFSLSSVVVNQATTATITVTDDDPDTADASSPTGTVGVSSDSGDAITGTCTLTAGNTGVSTCQVTITPKGKGTGTHNITASYPGSDVHTASTSAATPLTVTTRHATSVLSFSSNPVVVNQSTTVTLTVTDDDPNGTAVTPNEMITFSSVVGSDVFPNPNTCTLAGSGATASCSISLAGESASPSLHGITGAFPTSDIHSASGDTNNLTVNTRLTKTTVSFSGNPVKIAVPLAVTVTVEDIDPNGDKLTPSGTVTFQSDEGTDFFSFGACSLAAGSGATASCTLALTVPHVAKPNGAHTITSAYPLDNVHSASNGNNLLTVQPADTFTTIVSSTDPLDQGTKMSFTATVLNVSPGSAAPPVGTVQFFLDGNKLGSPVAVTPSNGTSSLATLKGVSLNDLGQSSNSITAHSISTQFTQDQTVPDFAPDSSTNKVDVTLANTVNTHPGQTISPLTIPFNDGGTSDPISITCTVQMQNSPPPSSPPANFPTCHLDQTTITLPQSVQVTLATVVATAGLIDPARSVQVSSARFTGLFTLGMPVVGVLGLLMVGGGGNKKRSRTKLLSVLGFMLLLSLLLLGAGCGGGFNNPNNLTPPVAGSTQAGQYVITITGTDQGRPVVVANIPLNVQF